MQQVGNILELTIKKIGCKKQYLAHKVFLVWEQMIGTDLAKYAVPKTVQNGILIVTAENSAWCHHLTMLKEDILNKINALLGEKVINDIWFQAGKINISQKEDKLSHFSENNLVVIDLSAEELSKIEEEVAEVSDQELKKKIIDTLCSRLKSEKQKKANQWVTCQCCDTLCPPGEKYCTICSLKIKNKKIQKIKTILLEIPWISCSEIKKYINCINSEYFQAKSELVNKLIQKSNIAKLSRLDELTLVMLLLSKKPDELTNEMFDKVIEKFGRKQYVSASRS